MEEKSDRGFVSGFIGVGIHMTIQHILQHIHIANRCKKELAELKDLVMGIELTIMHIQKNRLAFRTDEAKETSSFRTDEAKETPSAVNEWLEVLDSLLLQASKVVQRCSMTNSHFNRQTKKKNIDGLILKIRNQLELSPLLLRFPKGKVGDSQKVLAGLQQTQDRIEVLASCAVTSQAATALRDTAGKILTVGDEQASEELKKFLIDNEEARKICVFNKGGRGESGILMTLYENQEVRNHFSDGNVLRLTVTQSPSVTSLRKDLCKQIGVDLNTDVNEEDLKITLNQTLQQMKSFVLFLEDVWGGNASELLQGLGILDAVCDHIKCKVIVSSTDPTALLKMEDTDSKYTITIEEPVMVGQKRALADLADLENFVIDGVNPNKIGENSNKIGENSNKIVVVGECGAGKTLLKSLFNRQKVRTHFSNGLLLWLTLSQRPSATFLRNDLCKQIGIQKEIDSSKVIKEKEEKKWLSEQLLQSSRFALFLDDVSVMDGPNLFKELGIVEAVSDRAKSKVIVSSRDPSALSGLMGDADEHPIKYTVRIQDEADSWQLFKHHAFPYNIGNLPSNIDEHKARLVCGKCGGLPRAIKLVGRAMADSTHPQQWEWALERLTKSTLANSLDACLRLSFDAVGNQDLNIQLCFLHIAAAFLEDEIIDAQEVVSLWMAEGVLAMKMLQNGPAHILADRCFIEPMIRNTKGRPVCLRMQDPFELGRFYLDFLADRFLIEPTVRDAGGRVLRFRMLKVVRDLAIPIAKNEEYFYCPVGNSLEHLQNDNESKIKRIFLSGNELRDSFQQYSSCSEMRSLLISQETGLTNIPMTVIGNMRSLKVLDLRGTPVSSLPKQVGCLKELICLKLSGTQIKELPKSVTGLGHLEILDLSFSNIKELPSDIHMLRSLRYLGLRGCKRLQYLPYKISSLLSLQYLYMDGCSRMWTKPKWNKCKKGKVASMESLGDLVQLKQLALQNDSEAVSEGKLRSTLGSMTEMDTLLLIFSKMPSNMESVPLDINNMSRLRSLSLKCCNFTKMEIKTKNEVCSLTNLSYLKFYECSMFEDLQNLHKLQNLRHLEIIRCEKVKKFPKEFGEKDAFPLLRIFSLVGLQYLEELPEKEKGAMPSLKIFTIMDCPNLKMLPKNYLNLGIRTRVYGLPKVVEDLRNTLTGNMDLVQMVKISTDAKGIIREYLQVLEKVKDGKEEEDWLFRESGCNELFQFVEDYATSFSNS